MEIVNLCAIRLVHILTLIAFIFSPSVAISGNQKCTESVFTLGLFALTDIVYTGELFLAVDTPDGNFLSTNDAVNWKIKKLTPNKTERYIVQADRNSFVFDSNGNAFKAVNDHIIDNFKITDADFHKEESIPAKFIWANNKFFALPGYFYNSCFYCNENKLDWIRTRRSYSGFFLMSSNALEWDIIKNIPIASNIFFFNGEYWLLPTLGNISTSLDGKNWVETTDTLLKFPRDLAWNNMVYVIVGSDGLIMYSSDKGISWKKVNTGVSYQFNDILWDGTKFVVVGNCDTIATSSDGKNWNFSKISNKDPVLFLKVSLGKKIYIAIGVKLHNSSIHTDLENINIEIMKKYNYSGVIYVSIDGYHWEDYSEYLKNEYKKQYPSIYFE